MRHDIDDGRMVRLKAYRLNVRKPRLEAQRGELVLRLPAYFGRRAWRVPIGAVGVVDLTSPGLLVQPSDDDVYPGGIVIPAGGDAPHVAARCSHRPRQTSAPAAR